jgi:two-component system chemotaxis response regulator CheY
MRILVVEDDQLSLQVLARLLRRYGEVVEAKDGQSGLAAFQEAFSKGQSFSLICLDVMMPQMNGQTALKQIRDIEAAAGVPEGKRARVIMTTAAADKQNIMEALPHCDAYLTKPVDQASLLFYLRKFGFVTTATPEQPPKH